MKFDESFFEDEVRDGFYVPAMMKRCWASQMEVLQTFSEFCEQNNLRWFAAYGTLLGAVRHRGFIPWDDDIDVWMLRSDYERFVSLSNRLPDGMTFSEGRFGRPEKFDQPFGRLTNEEFRSKALNNNPELFMQFMKNYHGFLDVSGIDIFVLDRIAPTEDEEEDRYAACRIVLFLLQHLNSDDQETRRRFQQGLQTVNRWLPQPIDLKGNVYRQLMTVFEELNARFEESDSKELTAMHDWIAYHSYQFPAACFSETVELPFESMSVKAPAGFEEVLKAWHSDYMMPVQEVNHNYPSYCTFEKKCAEAGTPLMYLYPFRQEDIVPQRDILHPESIPDPESNNTDNKSTGKKRTVVFLVFKAQGWKNLELLYRYFQEQSGWEIKIVSVPYYRKDDFLEPEKQSIIEKNILSEYMRQSATPCATDISDADSFSLQAENPDLVITQNPYDDYSTGMTIDPRFYSSELRKYAGKVIYIPWFSIDEITPDKQAARQLCDSFIELPGVVRADLILLNSDNMRKIYVDKLTEMAGESTRKHWEAAVQAVKSMDELSDVFNKNEIEI